MTKKSEQDFIEEMYRELAIQEKEEADSKRQFLKKLKKLTSAKKFRGILLYLEDGWEDFIYTSSICNGVWDFRITDKPANKKFYREFWNKIYVCQYSVGDSGDSFEGSISIELRDKKFFTFNYSC